MKKNPILLLLAFAFILGCESKKEIIPNAEMFRLNQLGYYPNSVKQFVVIDTLVKAFELVDENGTTVFSDKLTNKGFWGISGEKVMMGDFSSFAKPGKYTLMVDGSILSFPFEIKEKLYDEALRAAIKSYFFQRASMPIEEKYGGIYQRAAGHTDMNCVYHPSTGKTSGRLDSPGGWYDAGDYGKYIGNASVSVGQMLNLIEMFPDIIPDNTLNIPESGNGISDLLDELKYELDWILTMQDDDGGVYHKLTAKNFSGFIMPEDYNLERLVIGKGTAATLNFSAVLAQASRLYKKIDPEWSGKALQASEKAFGWALLNDDIPYTNPEDVVTGAYDDDVFDDDFSWAASELFITTRNRKYADYMETYDQAYIHQLTNSWKLFVRNNGFHSLLLNRDKLDVYKVDNLTQGHLKLADSLLNKITNNPYHVALDRYEWGSNSDVLNQAMILCFAHYLTGNEKYLVGAEQINDYIFGKNAMGYCFLTGFGFKRVMHPHHRPSGADGIDDPIPGFIAGGPNNHRQDKSQVNYPSEFPAKAYMDLQASYASNEVCLNWNAPAVFVMGYLQMVR